MSMLAEMTWGQWALGSLLVFICFILMLVILLQKGRGGGFAGAFGGAGGSSTFGAKTGDVFTWITVIVAGLFVVVTVWSNFVFDESPRPKLASDSAQATPIEIPVEGQDGVQPMQPMKMELGVVDPKTGEKSTVLVPANAAPPGGAATTVQPYDATNAKPAESGQPSGSAAEGSAAPKKETPPEDEKKDESENRPNP